MTHRQRRILVQVAKIGQWVNESVTYREDDGRECFFVLTRTRARFSEYTGNRAVAFHLPVDKDGRRREWQLWVHRMVTQWNVLRTGPES